MAAELGFYGITDIGKARKNNEDALLVGAGEDGRLFAVADGMGGHEAGEVAAFLALRYLKDLPPEEPLADALRRAGRTILSLHDDEEFARMGATVVVARFRQTPSGSLEAEVAHVGDSRAYLLRDGGLIPLTEDHTLVGEMLKAGLVSAEEAAAHPRRNIVTRALGAWDARADAATFAVRPGDRVLLCSDGLSDVVEEARMSRILGAFPDDPEGAARGLVGAALRAGAPDNVTAVVVDVGAPARIPRRTLRPRKTGALRRRTREADAVNAGSPSQIVG